MENTVKQVIVVRKDLKMPVGKIAAQVAHASMASFLGNPLYSEGTLKVELTPEKKKWIEGIFTKVVLGIDDEDSLLKLFFQIDLPLKVLPRYLITDSGLTVFDGERTITCLGIGPADNRIIDHYTGHLKLL